MAWMGPILFAASVAFFIFVVVEAEGIKQENDEFCASVGMLNIRGYCVDPKNKVILMKKDAQAG